MTSLVDALQNLNSDDNAMQQARGYAKIVEGWRESGIVEPPTYPMRDTRRIIPNIPQKEITYHL